MKKALCGALITVLLAVGVAAPAQATTPSSQADAAVYINSNVPVPGVFTAGSGRVANEVGTLPAGSTFLVSFERLDGSKPRGTTTVTPSVFTDLRIERVGHHVYRITTKRDLRAGQSFGFIWSNAHWFNFHDRVKVNVKVESTSGLQDIHTSNNSATYDNRQRGF